LEKIAVLGPKGTFSDSASMEYINKLDNKPTQVYYPTIDEAFYSIGKECQLGIIPVENTLDGFVQRTLDFLLEMDLYIESEVRIPVQFSLISNVEYLKDIRKLYVQFKASGQCRNFIDSLDDVSILTTQSNMESFNIVEGGNFGEGAIIPKHMLSCSNANFKIDNVTDSENNYTRFIIVRQGGIKCDLKNDKSIKVPLYIMPEGDKPGMLFEMLKEFSSKHINLVSIMSRPTKLNMGTYNFYLEIDGKYNQKDIIKESIKKMSKEYKLKVLGFYST